MNLERKPVIRIIIGLILAVAVIGAGYAAAESGDGVIVSKYPQKILIKETYVEAPAPAGANDVVTDDQWAELFPAIAASYNANSSNSYTLKPDYLENDPYLVTIYQGYGFAIDYKEARGHTYCLEDVANTGRPHGLANCLTCKTGDFTALVNKMGDSAYSLSFDEVYSNMSLNVGCYNCHENNAGNAGELTVTHDYTVRLVENLPEGDTIAPEILSCGQCHIEYYFAPENKATSVPYASIMGMGPDAILQYYNDMGFNDWVDNNEEKFGDKTTGAGLLKAQHPEMETVLGDGNVHASNGLTCADCHMAAETDENGNVYSSHLLISPLQSETLLNTCAQCHGTTDMVEKVRTLQAEITARETVVGNNLAAFHEQLAAANHSGDYTEEELVKLRDLYRSAQWYFDFDYVENSEGAHNSYLANYCLDTAQEYIDEAMELFH